MSAGALRHGLVTIDPHAWSDELADRPGLAGEPLIADWASRPWPFVARRRCERDRPGRIALGLPLPPSHGKRRIAFDLAPSAVLSSRLPLALSEVRAQAPNVWHPTIDALLALSHEFGIEARVFGSFAWAAVTGLDYITSASDLDLLWPLTARTDLLLIRLAAHDAEAPGRLDGEIVNDAGAAVNWRELFADAPTVLTKTLDGVALRSKAEFLRSAGEPA